MLVKFLWILTVPLRADSGKCSLSPKKRPISAPSLWNRHAAADSWGPILHQDPQTTPSFGVHEPSLESNTKPQKHWNEGFAQYTFCTFEFRARGF